MEYLLSLAVLLVTAKSLEWLFERFRVHAMVAHVLTGILLGPFLLDVVHPGPYLRVLANFGLIMMMLYMGLTSNFSAIAQNTRRAVVVASLGVAFSLLFGLLTVLYFGKSLLAAAFVGITLGNTAIEVTSGVLLRERVKRVVSSVLMGAAFADDIIAVYLIGLVTAMTHGSLSMMQFLILTVKIFTFMAFVLLISEYLFKRSRRFYSIVRNTNVFFTFVLILTFSLAILADEFGLNQIIGAYLAGLTISRLKERRDPLVITRIKVNELVDNLKVVLTEFFIPLFFIYVGLMFSPSKGNLNLFLIFLLYVSAIMGKLIGCSLGSRLSGLELRDSVAIGIGMGGRGSLELAILNFGLAAGIIDSSLFASVVVVSMMCAFTTPIFFGKYVERFGGG